MNKINLTGQRFGKLVVIKDTGKRKRNLSFTLGSQQINWYETPLFIIHSIGLNETPKLLNSKLKEDFPSKNEVLPELAAPPMIIFNLYVLAIF